MFTIACIECIYFNQVYDSVVKETDFHFMQVYMKCLLLTTEGAKSSKFQNSCNFDMFWIEEFLIFRSDSLLPFRTKQVCSRLHWNSLQ